MEFTKEEIKQGMNEAYQQAGHNAYFGNGFKAGIAFALAKMEREKIGRLEGVSDIEEEEDTEFCPHCNSADIYCEGGEFNEWGCNDCGHGFSEPNVK